MTNEEMGDKEESARTIFGVCRADCSVLKPFTPEQEMAVLEMLESIDGLDSIHDKRGGATLLVKSFNDVKEKHEQKFSFLPDADLKTRLLAATLKAYEDMITLTVGAEFGGFQGDITPTLAVARMRKAFLRKIISNDLDSDAQQFVSYLIGGTAAPTDALHRKIPLPGVTRTSATTAHPYPIQVSLQTQEFIQAVLFYAMFADTAAGAYVRLPNALNNIEKELNKEGLDKAEWNRGWGYLQKYQAIFNNTIFQNVVILMRSHWDWYIRQIGEFINFGRAHIASPPLTKKQESELNRIGWSEITRQLLILEESSGINLNLPLQIFADISEMSLVRNLGLHNRWEVDAFYLSKTSSSVWELRDIRIIEIGELQSWARSLSKLITETSLQIAVKYVGAPDYP
jgi:hypothetical protein